MAKTILVILLVVIVAACIVAAIPESSETLMACCYSNIGNSLYRELNHIDGDPYEWCRQKYGE